MYLHGGPAAASDSE